jgi:multiple sugar transport system substrate-binding protein
VTTDAQYSEAEQSDSAAMSGSWGHGTITRANVLKLGAAAGLGLGLAGRVTPADAASTVTLSFATYAFDPWSKIFPQMAQQFEKEHPNIKLQVQVSTWNTLYTKMQAEAMAHRGVPDVFIMDPSILATLASRGILMPLDNMVAANHLNLNEFYANSITDCRYNTSTRTIGSGNLYALPLTNDQDEVFFNQTAFQKAHVALPHDGWTWNQLRDAAIKLTLDDHGRNPTQHGFDGNHIVQYGLNINDANRGILEVIEDWGGAIIGSDYTHSVIDQSPAVAAISFLASMYKMHVIPLPNALSALADPFIAGKVAMSLDGDWQVNYYADTITKFNWDIAPVPLGPRGTPYIIGDTNSWSIYAGTAHPKEAWELLSWLVGHEAMTKYAAQIGLPSLKSAASAWSAGYKAPAHRALVLKYMKYTHNNQEGLHENEWRTAVDQNLDAVWLGKVTPAKGAQTTASAINRILQSS